MGTDRKTDRLTDRQTDRQTDRPMDIATYRAAIAAKNRYQVVQKTKSSVLLTPCDEVVIEQLFDKNKKYKSITRLTKSMLNKTHSSVPNAMVSHYYNDNVVDHKSA